MRLGGGGTAEAGQSRAEGALRGLQRGGGESKKVRQGGLAGHLILFALDRVGPPQWKSIYYCTLLVVFIY